MQQPSSPAPGRAVEVGGFTICGRGGRVWIHRVGDGDGDLSPTVAYQLALAIADATAQAMVDAGQVQLAWTTPASQP